MGCPVLGYRTEELPAFYTRKSGLEVDRRVDTPEEAARILHAKWDNGLEGGVMITNPIDTQYELDADSIEETIERAVKQAQSEGIRGKALTPYLWGRIKELTGGESLKANIELVRSNAELAARIACSDWGR